MNYNSYLSSHEANNGDQSDNNYNHGWKTVKDIKILTSEPPASSDQDAMLISATSGAHFVYLTKNREQVPDFRSLTRPVGPRESSSLHHIK